MWKLALLLILTLIILPFGTFYFDHAPSELQSTVLIELMWVCSIAAGVCYVVSSLVKNYSQVDKLWSIMPIVYVWISCYRSDFDPRTVLMACLVTVWGVRLTYNFARRGGYSWRFWEGEEDYRWKVIRRRKEFQHPVVWNLFNLFFVSFYQMALILFFTLPVVKSMEGGPLGVWDIVLAVVFLGLVVVEWGADQQQWRFQTEKYRKKRAGEALTGEYAVGFLRKGLWSVVRHPNYAAEQAIWLTFYGFSVVATGNWINWSLAGSLLLMLLFQGSSDLSEKISAEKYPEYADYQRKAPKFIPFFK